MLPVLQASASLNRNDQQSIAQIRTWLHGVAPAGTVVATDTAVPTFCFSNPETDRTVGRSTFRRAEFSAGRRLARLALATLGCATSQIPIGERGMPIWPEGYVGSITHCDGLCAALAARAGIGLRSIGIDIERTNCVDSVLAELVLSQQERRFLGEASFFSRDIGSLIFSAKESIYKAAFPIVRRFLDFSEVSLDLDERLSSFRTAVRLDHPGPSEASLSIVGRFCRLNSRIVTIAWCG